MSLQENFNLYKKTVNSIIEKGKNLEKGKNTRETGDLKHELICELFAENTFDTYTFQGNGFKFYFEDLRQHRDSFSFGTETLMKVKVALDSNAHLKRTDVKKIGEMFVMKICAEKGIFDLIINYSTGDLMYTTAGNIKSIFDKEEDYYAFRNEIFEVLLEFLIDLDKKNREADQNIIEEVELSDLDLKSEVIEQTELVREGLEDVLEIQKPEVLGESNINVLLNPVDSNSKLESEKRKKGGTVSLKNIDYDKARRALVHFLGEPLRQHGSHMIFQARDNGTISFPYHGDGDIGVGLLVKILRDAGIDKFEFLRFLK